MAEETVLAESSAAAAVATEPKFTQYDGWDDEGNPVVSKKTESEKQDKPAEADSAAADASKETKTEDAADSAAKKKQEQAPKNRTEARIKELLARAEKAEQDLAEARKPNKETKADSSTASKTETQPTNAPATRTKPKIDDKGSDGKPKWASYEDFNEALTDWKVDEKIAAQQREQQVTQQRQSLGKHLEEARGRYADFDTVTKPVIQEMLKPDIPREVFAVINDSPVLADLLYTIGGTEASKADFLEACRTNPGKALRVALLMEQEIVKELGKGKAAAKKDGDGEGKTETAPASVKPRAPKPPSEVGGRGATGEDALISAARSGNFRDFDAEQTRRVMASRK